ncbi:MAG: hypothetical protein AAF693_00945 [Bacteroidota bacterium]
MKFIIKLILTAGFSAAIQLFLPFWSVAIIAFLVCFLSDGNGFSSFLSGFLAVGLLWAIVALIIDTQTSSILSSKIAFVLPLNGSVPLLTLFTVLIGALVGGFGALSGSMFRALFRKQKKTGYYS